MPLTKNNYLSLLTTVGLLLLVSSCQLGPEVIHDLSDESYEVLDQDSSSVTFPENFKDEILVISYIYTNCPDICPTLSAKLGNVEEELGNDSEVHFVEITFDPRRDTPSVLKKYMETFGHNPDRFTMITGDSTTVDSLLNDLDIVAELADGESLDENYVINHTNRISIMDKQGRVRYEYPGTAVPEEHLIEDIESLR